MKHASEDVTERFMWDFRRTCADMFADNYLGYMSDLCHEHGILLYNEPYNSSVFDEMQAGTRADIPMGEFWVRTHQDRTKVKMVISTSRALLPSNGPTTPAASNWSIIRPARL